MLDGKPQPNQLSLDWSKDALLERIIETRVALRAEADAVRWRVRLILIETVMMTVLVGAAGIALDQPVAMVVRAGLFIGGTCFVSGMLLIGLSSALAWSVSRFERWRRR
jgi:hypothetical protein